MKTKLKYIIFMVLIQALFFINIFSTIPGVYALKNLLFKSITPSSDVVGKYQKFEVDIKINLTFKNPYNSEEVSLWGNFVSPTGKKYRVPGFYYQNFKRSFKSKKEELKKDEKSFWKNRFTGDGQWQYFLQEEKLKKTGKPLWKIRFTPTEEGKWDYCLEFEYGGKRSVSERQHFEVIGSDDAGFIRVSKKNSSYFTFDDGTPYFPVGQNVSWYRSSQDVSSYERESVVGTGDYDRWYEEYAKYGVNYSRIWLIPWAFGQEWKDTDTGLGNYNKGQRKAWRLDYVLELAKEKGIYTLFTLLPHGPFSPGLNSIWKHNPYNKANGGPLISPGEFLTDPTAKKYFKNLLRYIAARWGYSTDIVAWEWWNEVNWTACNDVEKLSNWIKEMTEFMKSLDVNNHLFSISYSGIGANNIWRMKEISYVQIHGYDLDNYALSINGILRSQVKKDFGKPILFSEFAENSPLIGDTDPKGVHLHNSIWAAALTPGSAGSAMIWWWDLYTEPYNLYYHYGGLSQFLKGERWDEENFKAVNIEIIGDADIEIYGVGNSRRLLLWMRAAEYNLQKYKRLVTVNVLNRLKRNKSDKRIDPLPEDCEVPFLINNAQLEINDLQKGSYSIEFWDTYTGAIIATREGSVGDKGQLLVDVPEFDKDIACKIYKNM